MTEDNDRDLYKARLALELEQHKAELSRLNAEMLASQERQWQSSMEQWKANWQHNLETWKVTAQHNMEVWKVTSGAAAIGFQAIVDFAIAALKGIILANGGAVITLLAFLGHIWSSDSAAAKKAAAGLVDPLIFFSGSTGLGIFAAGTAYVSQALFSEFAMRPNGKVRRWPGEVFRAIGVITAFAGIAGFFVGTLHAASAFREGAQMLTSPSVASTQSKKDTQ